ncbi:MAG: hypothetical protein KGQ48_12645, partial [Bradyrhizobium sp.]|nr:hypothetical protein [Bradyrhizobium sp.]
MAADCLGANLSQGIVFRFTVDAACNGQAARAAKAFSSEVDTGSRERWRQNAQRPVHVKRRRRAGFKSGCAAAIRDPPSQIMPLLA